MNGNLEYERFFVKKRDNWRGINLRDMVSKVISIAMTNRLQLILKSAGKYLLPVALVPSKFCTF